MTTVTAETITDDMIRTLRKQAFNPWDDDLVIDCALALGLPSPVPHPTTGIPGRDRATARERCAAAWNARLARKEP